MPKRPCMYPNCNQLVDMKSRFCERHKPKEKRPSAAERGYDSKWVKARKSYLAKHPMCVACERQGILTMATDVDHIIAHRGDKRLFWDSQNWQSLCHSCHSKKTQQENNGGWY